MDTQHFTRFRKESLAQLQSLEPKDVVFFDDDVIAENYTIILRPNFEVVKTIKNFLQKLKILEPNQYYYPTENLHLTLIGNISVNVDLELLLTSIDSAITKYKFAFDLRGVASNQYCSSFSAYPKDFSLHDCREEIRKMINFHGDNFSSILESYEYVGWMNYLRYLNIPRREFLGFLYTANDKYFGQMNPTVAQLYRNTSKVLDPKKAILVASFEL